MSHKTLKLLLCILSASLVLLTQSVWSRGFYSLLPMLPHEEYGNIFINRTSEQEKVQPAVFSHWTHRLRYTCEVCHTELEFSMKVNTTEISHNELNKGRYCGACHNGTTAFSHQRDCIKCHTEDSSYIKKKYVYFGKKPFPTTEYGNGIDWTQSLRRGLISPRRYLNEEPSVMDFDRTIELTAEMRRIPPAYFSHKSHLDWMGCDMCHPEVFNIQKKGTENFSMREILKGRFCGGCHLNVAFPIDDCNRCHPEVRSY